MLISNGSLLIANGLKQPVNPTVKSQAFQEDCCPETSVTTYKPMPRNIPEEQ
jgi:hypothetical protein